MAINWGEVGAGAFAGVQQGEEIAWRSFQAQQQKKESARLERQTAIAEAENTRKQREFDLTMPIREMVIGNQTAAMQDGQRRAAARAATDFNQRFNPNGVDVSLELNMPGATGAVTAPAARAEAANGTLIDRGQPTPRPAPAPVTAPPAAVREAAAAPAAGVSAPAPAVRLAPGPVTPAISPAAATPSVSGISVIQMRGGGPGETGGPPELPTYQPTERRLLHQLITEIPGLTGSSIARQRELYAKLGGESVNGPYRGTTQQNLWLRGQIVSNTYQQALQQQQGGSGPAEAAPVQSAPVARVASDPVSPAPPANVETEYYGQPAPMSRGSAEGLVDLTPAPGTVPAQELPASSPEPGRAPAILDSIYRQDLYRGMLDQKRQFEQDQQEWEQQRKQAEEDDFVSRYPIYGMRMTVGGIDFDIPSRDEAIKQHYDAMLKAQEYNYQMTLTDSLLNDMGMVPTGATRNARGQLTFRYKNPQTNEEIDFTNDEVNMLEGVWQESLRADDATGRPAGHVSAEIYQMLSPILKRVPNLMAWRKNQNGEFLSDGNGNPIPDTDPTGRYYRLSDDAWDIFAAGWRRDEEKNQRVVTSAISSGLGRYRDVEPPETALRQFSQMHNAAFPNDPWTEDDVLQQWNAQVISSEDRQAMDQARRTASYQRSVELTRLRDSLQDENRVQQHDFQRSMQALRSAGRISGSGIRSNGARPTVNFDEYYSVRENIESIINRLDTYANVDENGKPDGTLTSSAPVFLREMWDNPQIRRALNKYIDRDGNRQSMATANPGNAVILDETRRVLAREMPNSVFAAAPGRGAAAAGTGSATVYDAAAALGD